MLSLKRALVKRNSGLTYLKKGRKFLFFRIPTVCLLALTLLYLEVGILKPHERASYFQKCNFRQEESFRNRLRLSEQAMQSMVENRVTSPNQFWYGVEPTWSCVNERRIGTYGDGGKYICDIVSLQSPEK